MAAASASTVSLTVLGKRKPKGRCEVSTGGNGGFRTDTRTLRRFVLGLKGVDRVDGLDVGLAAGDQNVHVGAVAGYANDASNGHAQW